MSLIDSKSIHHLDGLRPKMKFGKEAEGLKEGVNESHRMYISKADRQTTSSTPDYTFHPSTSLV